MNINSEEVLRETYDEYQVTIYFIPSLKTRDVNDIHELHRRGMKQRHPMHTYFMCLPPPSTPD